jgi:hypothetical protein
MTPTDNPVSTTCFNTLVRAGFKSHLRAWELAFVSIYAGLSVLTVPAQGHALYGRGVCKSMTRVGAGPTLEGNRQVPH